MTPKPRLPRACVVLIARRTLEEYVATGDLMVTLAANTKIHTEVISRPQAILAGAAFTEIVSIAHLPIQMTDAILPQRRDRRYEKNRSMSV